MPKSRGKRGRGGGGNNKLAPDAKKRRITTNTNDINGSLFDVKPHVGMRLDARDVDYIWSSATLIRLVKKNNHSTRVTIRFDGWGKAYDETLEWNLTNQQRLAPLYSFTKCVKCLVDLFPKKRSTPTKEELDAIPRNAPPTYSRLWPCKVQFRMPHPQNNNEDEDNDSEECLTALADLKLEPHIFIQPYHIESLPQHVLDLLKENDGMWIKAKRIQPWTNTPAQLGVLPVGFMDAFQLANEDTETPGVLPLGSSVIGRGSLLKEQYRVHSRQGSLVRDGALREEDENEGEYSEEEEVVEEDIVKRKVPAQPAAMQQQQRQTSTNSDSKTSTCVVM